MSHTSMQCTHSAQLNTAQLTFTLNVTDNIVISVLVITFIGIFNQYKYGFCDCDDMCMLSRYVQSLQRQLYYTAQLIPAAATTVMP